MEERKLMDILMDILKFCVIGSVDDGKSTLIGRLLHDSGNLYEDQIQELRNLSFKRNLDVIDYSLITDGLRSERDQGITIDVAYRYFTTKKRKYIIADSPGHVQYTRNMFTAASNSNLAIILIDAEKGLTSQSKRHLLIASLVGIKHLIVCINKMDLVNYCINVYEKILEDFRGFSKKLNISDIKFLPISAKEGVNIVKNEVITDWYTGFSLFKILEETHISSDLDHINTRFIIQNSIRYNNNKEDYRGFAGRLLGGALNEKESIKLLHPGLPQKLKVLKTTKAIILK